MEQYCKCWYWILIKQTKALVVLDPGLWTLPMVTWSCLGFLSALVPISTSLVWSLAATHLRRPCAWYYFPCISENWYFEVGETYICWHPFVTSLLFAFVLPILEYCSSVWGSATECHLQLLQRQVYSIADQSFLSLCHRRHVAINSVHSW